MFTSCVIISACCKERIHEELQIQRVDTTFLRNSVKMFVLDYLEKNRQYDCFTLLTDLEYNWREGVKQNPPILVLGPTMEGLFDREEGTLLHYPSMYMEYHDKVILIQSSLDECNCIDSTIFNRFLSVKKCHVIERKKGSNPLVDYLSESIAFTVSADKVTLISNRTDTLLLKKRKFFFPPL